MRDNDNDDDDDVSVGVGVGGKFFSSGFAVSFFSLLSCGVSLGCISSDNDDGGGHK